MLPLKAEVTCPPLWRDKVVFREVGGAGTGWSAALWRWPDARDAGSCSSEIGGWRRRTETEPPPPGGRSVSPWESPHPESGRRRTTTDPWRGRLRRHCVGRIGMGRRWERGRGRGGWLFSAKVSPWRTPGVGARAGWRAPAQGCGFVCGWSLCGWQRRRSEMEQGCPCLPPQSVHLWHMEGGLYHYQGLLALRDLQWLGHWWRGSCAERTEEANEASGVSGVRTHGLAQGYELWRECPHSPLILPGALLVSLNGWTHVAVECWLPPRAPLSAQPQLQLHHASPGGGTVERCLTPTARTTLKDAEPSARGEGRIGV